MWTNTLPGMKKFIVCTMLKRMNSSLDYKINAVIAEHYPDVETACPLGFSYFPITLKDPETRNYTRVEYIISTNDNFFDVFSVPVLSSLKRSLLVS